MMLNRLNITRLRPFERQVLEKMMKGEPCYLRQLIGCSSEFYTSLKNVVDDMEEQEVQDFLNDPDNYDDEDQYED